MWLTYHPPQPAEGRQTSICAHKDNGSVTLLFDGIGGFQMLPRGLADEECNRRWVRLGWGCAIFNFGDALVQWSRGTLRSKTHCVVSMPSQQA
jgi:isopenicillin N synthase-like dioxygenase